MRLISSISVTAESKVLIYYSCDHYILMLALQKIDPFKKALHQSAFFMAFFLVITVFSSLLIDCEAKPIYQKVAWVYDGDTLRLKDGRKIRLIGMNAPEVAHHKKKGQPYGREATEKLRQLLKSVNYKVRLETDLQKRDRYKRYLVHVFLADGTDLSQWMLQNGWASLMIFPPNTRYIGMYRKAEQSAQKMKRHIWLQSNYQIHKASQLKKGYRGYVRLKSNIKSIKITKKTIFLELDKKIFIKLSKHFIHYFTHYDPKNLLHDEVIIRGFLYKSRGKRIITLRHPAQLELKGQH